MGHSITLTNLSSGKKYRFYDGEVSNASYSLNEKKIQESIAGGDAEDSISINLGKTVSVSFAFKLLDTPNDDASVGDPGSINTIQEKLNYLLDTFFTNGTDDFYLVDMITQTGSILNKKVSVDGYSFDFANLNVSSLTGRMTLILGGGNQ